MNDEGRAIGDEERVFGWAVGGVKTGGGALGLGDPCYRFNKINSIFQSLSCT